MNFTTLRRHERWLTLAGVLACAALSFSMFGFTLSRYPPVFDDESFFNAPAVRELSGKSFAYVFHVEEPHASTLLSHHSPFFFRTQVLAFRLLGLNHVSCRLPSWLGGHLAILLLALMLWRRGLQAGALLLATLWVGDRSTQELLLGRPEGVNLLLLAACFALEIRALERDDRRYAAAAGLALGLSAGFNVATLYFAPAALLGVLLLARRRAPMAVSFITGMLPAAVAFLLCWLPHPLQSWEQFRWFLHYSHRTVDSWPAEIATTWAKLGYARYWVFALAAVTVFALPPLSLRRWRAARPATPSRFEDRAILLSTFFAIAALLLFADSSRNRYYFALFTAWPIVGLACCISLARGRRSANALAGALTLFVLLAWLPSLEWNVMRCREALMMRGALDDRPAHAHLRERIPRDTRLFCDPKYFLILQRAGIAHEYLPWYPRFTGYELPDDAWFIVSGGYLYMMMQERPDWFAQRRLVEHAEMYPRAKAFEEAYFLYGPASNAVPAPQDLDQ